VDGLTIPIPDGTSRQAAYRLALSALDDHYTSGSVPDVHEPSEAVDPDIDIDPESSEPADTSVGEADSGIGRETTDSGESDPPAELGGGSVDEGVTDEPDRTPVEAGSPDVEPTSVERTEPESGESQSESGHSAFVYAAFEATRGVN